MTRTTVRFWLLVAIGAASLTLAACGGDDGEDLPTGSPAPPAGTKASPTPMLPAGETPGPEVAPEPPPPELDETARVLVEGVFKPVVNSQVPFPWDLTSIPLDDNATPPPCERFVVAFSWQVSVPYPPGANEAGFELVRDTGNVQIGRGINGSAQTGCGTLNIINHGQGSAEVTIHYKVGAVP